MIMLRMQRATAFNLVHFVYHMEGRFSCISSNVFSESSESFVQPKTIPPLHRHQVPKPLRGRAEKREWEEGRKRGEKS